MQRSRSARRLSLLLLPFTFYGRPVDAASVTGRVVDPSARAVPGAQVLVLCGQRLSATAVTDAEGKFRIDDAQGSCELRIGLPGFAAAPVPLDLPEGSTVVVVGCEAMIGPPPDLVGHT